MHLRRMALPATLLKRDQRHGLPGRHHLHHQRPPGPDPRRGRAGLRAGPRDSPCLHEAWPGHRAAGPLGAGLLRRRHGRSRALRLPGGAGGCRELRRRGVGHHRGSRHQGLLPQCGDRRGQSGGNHRGFRRIRSGRADEGSLPHVRRVQTQRPRLLADPPLPRGQDE